MAKLVPAYMSDKGDRMYSLRSQAIAADIEWMTIEVTKSIVGDINPSSDEFRGCRHGLSTMLKEGLSPRSLQRKYSRLFRLRQKFLQAQQEEKSIGAEDIPF